jgi:hypothetical protein
MSFWFETLTLKPLRRSARKAALSAEAAAFLIFFRLALRILPFKLVASWIKPTSRVSPLDKHPALVRRVRWAVLRVSRKSPVLLPCFPQSLAAHIMLKRRRVPTTLYYGVGRFGSQLEAHTWLKAGEHFVVGGELSPQFTPLVCFPISKTAGRGFGKSSPML